MSSPTLTFADGNILAANTDLVGRYLYDNTPSFAFGELRHALERATQIIAAKQDAA